MKKYFILFAGLLSLSPVCAQETDNKGSVVDEVIWVVGDEPILKSEVEYNRMMSAMTSAKSLNIMRISGMFATLAVRCGSSDIRIFPRVDLCENSSR